MRILLTNYNYYPYAYGGSEVYVSALARYLHQKGHDVYIMAAVPDLAFQQHPVLYEDNDLRVCQYPYEYATVYGIQHRHNTVFENYRRYLPSVDGSWIKFFEVLPGFALLHMNAFTPFIGMNLVNAFKLTNPKAKRITSYHTPISCPKGSLVYGRTGDECTINPNPHTCGACLLATSSPIPFSVTKLLSTVLPDRPHKLLPNSMYRKYLAGIAIESFQELERNTHEWIVYSDGVRETLKINGVNTQKISRLVHGINTIFFSTQPKSPSEQVFVYNGRFDKIKGVETLMHAWLRLAQLPHRRLLITVNPHHVPAQFKEIVLQLQQRSDVQFLGPMAQKDLLDVYRHAHCIIIPSLSVEIGPLVFHEAIASGCNVIASDIGGCAELHKHYKSRSTVFRAKDDRDLAKKIDEFVYQDAPSAMPISQDDHYKTVYSIYERLVTNASAETVI